MKVESSFFCDDVRQEINGKFFFIGSYVQDILVSVFPANLNLIAVLICNFDVTGEQEIEVEVRLVDQILLKGKMTANIASAGNAFVPIPFPLANISQEGALVLRIKTTNAKWKQVAGINLKLTPNPIVANVPTS